MNINAKDTGFQRVKDITISDNLRKRIKTDTRLDDIFGGGLVPGSCITIYGEGGSGKSTLLCQLLSLIDSMGKRTAYATGEESSEQLALTCERLDIDNIDLAHIKDVDDIVGSMQNYDIIVVDSFQSLKKPKSMRIGEFRQYAQDTLINKAKETGCILIFVLHITTSGLPKGGTDIIHAVDVNIKMKVDGQWRVIDTYKNRLGKTGQHNFLMGPRGFLFNEVTKPIKRINYLEVVGNLLSKSRNHKWKYLGECLSSVDRILKKMS